MSSCLGSRLRHGEGTTIPLRAASGAGDSAIEPAPAKRCYLRYPIERVGDEKDIKPRKSSQSSDMSRGLAAGGRRVTECVREIGVTEVTYYRWRNRYGGLESDLAEHLTELEAEIARLRRLVSDLTLDKLILAEATAGALSPELRAAYVLHARAAFGVSERRACQALGQHRSTQRKIRARLSLEAPAET